jgi:hypothetical protein
VTALAPKDAEDYRVRREAWESALPKTVWHPLEGVVATSVAGATLALQPDGSVLASGMRPDKDTYTIVGFTRLEHVSAIRLEALPDPSLPMGGPGRADSGNFVLAELKVTAVPAHDPVHAKAVALANASADYSQNEFVVASAIDGKIETGWAIYPQPKVTHRAVFETGADVGGEGGTLLVLTLEQPYGGGHTLGRLRLSVTDAPPPVREVGIADEVIAAALRPAAERTSAEQLLVHRAFVASAHDVAGRMRLAAAQDVAWALATSPAFLFNR